jgi:hypothetical protein
MIQKIWRRWFLLAVVLVLPQTAQAGNTEYRDFSITVDGKLSGSSLISIAKQAGGSFTVNSQGVVRITQVFFKYEFSTQAVETWKDGRLVSLKASTTENSKKVDVTATALGPSLRVQVNSQPERMARPEVWTNSYWKLADAKYHNKDVPVLEEDTGKEFTGRLTYLGTETLNIVNQGQPCYHFRLTGGASPVDLWFDRFHLLVKMDYVESGHRTIMQVTNIRR